MAKQKNKWIGTLLKALGKEGNTKEALYEIADNGGYLTLGIGLALLSKLEYYWATTILCISAIMFVYKWHVHNKIYPIKKKK
ncbi:MAG: hypothetical protein GON13_00020 [Nanoarchaeota archaeon]|nr:hypothetical protein [Nanoarchaeota archaeon]